MVKKLLVFPLKPELHLFLEKIRAEYRVTELEGMAGRVFSIADRQVFMAQCGHGKAQAALQTQYLLGKMPFIERVFCVGAAGALAPRMNVGDVLIASETVEHDFHEKFVPRPSPRFSGDPELLAHAKSCRPDGFAVHTGPIVSGDEDIVSADRKSELHSAHGALAVAWEGAGVARTARFNRLPYLEVRGITDLADASVFADFQQNLGRAMSNIASTMPHFF